MKNEIVIHKFGLEDLTPTESVVGAEIKISEIKLIMKKTGWFDESAIAIKDEIDEAVYLLDGHHRLAAAQEIGMNEIPVIIVKFDDLPKFHLYYNSMEDIRRAARNVGEFRRK